MDIQPQESLSFLFWNPVLATSLQGHPLSLLLFSRSQGIGKNLLPVFPSWGKAQAEALSGFLAQWTCNIMILFSSESTFLCLELSWSPIWLWMWIGLQQLICVACRQFWFPMASDPSLLISGWSGIYRRCLRERAPQWRILRGIGWCEASWEVVEVFPKCHYFIISLALSAQYL